MKQIRNILTLLLLPATALLGACTASDEWEQASAGSLQLSMPGISTHVSPTRTTPAGLGKPAATDFHLTVVRQGNDAVIYNGNFTEDKITAAPDNYSILATYGTNPVIALDAPYYVGSTTATVTSTTEPTPVSLPVKVANALISVQFGDTEENAERFGRFYETYALNVAIGNNSASITHEAPQQSVYVRDGSTVQLTFSGYLKALGHEVSMPIVLPEDISYTLHAAQHLIITLGLEPDAESAVVNVQKAELDSVGIDEKISYNWLPRPAITAQHQYVRGELVGTDLSIGASFPDVVWEAKIHQGSATGQVVRTLTGQGALTSSYKDNADWPFLPAGTYVATYTYTSKQGQKYNFDKTTVFTVPQPSLTLTSEAYTSYSLYEQGNIAEANACERLTVYEPKVQCNIADALLANSNYTGTYTTAIAGQTATTAATRNTMTLADITGVPVSGTPYTLTVSAAFCGQTVSATQQVRITGLPVTFAPPRSSEWSRSGSGSWNDGYAVLGNRGGLLTESDETLTNTTSVNIPAGTHFNMDYYIVIHPATIGTTFSVTCNNRNIFTQRQDGGALNTDDYPFQGSTAAFHFNEAITQLQCQNSYGGGQTCTNIYSLTFKYAE